MPETAQTSARPHATAGGPPVVHLTRRERIAAERAAAARSAGGAGGARVEAAVRAQFADGSSSTHGSHGTDIRTPVAPTTPAAPSSPVLPESTTGPATPPAPSSPMLAGTTPTASRRTAAGPGTTRGAAADATATDRAFDRLVGIDGAPATVTTPIVFPTAPDVPAAPAPRRRRDARSATPRPGTRRAAASARGAVPARDAGAIIDAGPRRADVPAAQSGRGRSFRRNASRATAVGAVLFSAGLLVSTSLPAQALWTAQDARTVDVTAASVGRTQSVDVGNTAAAGVTNRDAYTVSDQTQYKNTDSSTFTNDPDGTIQWPFLTGVPITSGFGGRNVEGCSFCSTNHMGVDFAPGEGTPIRVIAAGTVIKVQADDGGFGNDVWVQHDVDGKQFVSVYGHMEDNSFQVVQGQQVAVGDVLGKVGSTGNSTGPHLHLEIHVNDVPVDPLAWLKANAN